MTSTKRLLTWLLSVMVALAMLLCAPAPALAEEAITTHDMEQIREALMEDGDVTITLDGDAHQDRTDWYEGDAWCVLGSGNKTIDLAGYDLEMEIWHFQGRQLYMFVVDNPATTFTITDSSPKGDGTVAFDAYLAKVTRGSAGFHASDYYPVHVQYRNVVRVKDGSFVFNRGKIKAGRKKSEYVGYGINVSDLVFHLQGGQDAFLRYDGYINKMINSCGIIMEGGSVLVNGGTVEGRGYRELITGGPKNGYVNTYTPAAAIYGTGGTLVINDGVFESYSGANVLDLSEACTVSVRAGSFFANDSGRVAVPHPSDGMFGDEEDPYASIYGGGEYGSHAPLYKSGERGGVGILGDYLDEDLVNVLVDDEAADYWYMLRNEHDVVVKPKDHGDVTLIDSRTNAKVEGDTVVWDGTSPCTLTVPVRQVFTGYPWMNSYWVAVAESTKSNPEGTSPTIYMGGQKMSEPEAAPVEKIVGYNSSYPEVQSIMSSGSGSLSFDLAELKPEGVGQGSSFIVDFYICQNLQPGGTGGYSQYYNCTRTIVVQVEPTNPVVEFGPEDYYGDEETITLRAAAENATEAWWVQEWPQYQVLDGTFDTGAGMAELTVPVGTSAAYYRCYFRNKYAIEKTEAASVRKPLNYDVVGTQTDVTFYTGEPYGDLVVTGDLMRVWMSVGPDDREVHWYRLNGGEKTPINYEAGNHITPSTPHYRFGTPSAADEGQYMATIGIRLNGEMKAFDTGVYNVTVVEGSDPTVIRSIELYGLGEPYLGGPVPDEIVASDERYTIESVNWNGASGGTLNVREAYFEVRLKAAEGYTFASAGAVPVTMDGVAIGSSTMGSIPNTTAYISYTFSQPGHIELVPRTGLDEVAIEVAPGEEIDIELKSSQVYTSYGAVGADASVVASAFSAAGLPSWATLNADGTITGTVPADAVASLTRSAVTYRTNTTGSVNISSGITLMVAGIPSYMKLSGDPTVRWHEHQWGAWADNEDGTHTRTCATCKGTETAEHVWGEGEEQDGALMHTCTLCDATYEENVESLGHAPLEPVAGVPATCTVDGTKEHYECTECGALFWDGDGLEAVEKSADLVIPATGHDWGAWEDVTKPTASSAGEQRRVCGNDPSHVETRATYLITYDLNGGRLDGKTGKVTLVVPEGETITLPLPSRAGYSFDYWKGSVYHAGDTYTATESHTFTAQWTQPAAPSRHSTPSTGDATTGVVPMMALGLILVAGSLMMRRRGVR